MAGLKDKLFTPDSTIFRNLKYGKDTPGGGNSKEPFVNRNSLPGLVEQSPDLGLLGGNSDFLLRGGTLKRSADDVSRLSQLLFTTGKGGLFTVKQNLLSRSAVATQASGILNEGAYLPTSTIAQVGVAGLGFHLNKQGINPFRKTGTATGDLGLPFGLTDPTGLPVYSTVVNINETPERNRLVQLTDTKLIGPQDIGSAPFISRGNRLLGNIASSIDNFIGTNLKSKVNDLIPNLSPALLANNISSNKDNILEYGGGPGSEIGVGKTIIRRYQDSTLYNTESFRKTHYLLDGGHIKYLSDESVQNLHKVLPDFRKALIEQQKTGVRKNILSDSPDYERKNIETRVGLGDPGTSQKDLTSYTGGTGNGALDKVNALPLYQSKGVTADKVKNDLIKFRMAVHNPHDKAGKKTYIHFRAFLDTFTDNYTSEWESFKYMGRTEQFHKYQGFTRSVSLSWKLVAQSREELIPMYKKLNYLQSVMAGDYSPSGYMEGNIVDLTVGGYFWEQPGFFTSLNVTFPEKET